MVKQSAKESTAVHAALQYAARGWHVLPLNSKNAPAAGGAGVKDATTDEAQIRRWWEQYPTAGVGIAAEPSGLVIIDLDRKGDVDGFASWDALLLPDVNTHKGPRARTRNGGQHLFYDRDDVMYSSTVGKIGTGIDVRCYGGYVAASPTPGYVWLSEGETVPPPGSVCQVLSVRGGAKKGTLHALKTGNQENDTYAGLLANPPTGENSGRNTWLHKVASHLATREKHEDAFFSAMRSHAAQLRPPLSDAEITKTLRSAWDTHQRNHGARGQADVDNGWLFGNDARLWTTIQIGEKEDRKTIAVEWADFDIEALGVTAGTDTPRIYDVNIHANGKIERVTLPSAVLGNTNALHNWLAEHGCTIAPPGEPKGRGQQHARLHRYIKQQNPPVFTAVPHLGWHDGQFLVHEGIIDPEQGLLPFTAAKPVIGRDWAPFRYGFDVSEHDAVAVLREVLTYQEEEYAAVVGAWFAASYIKPMFVGHQFPILGVIASSGRGKSTGLLGKMMRLSGRITGPGKATYATCRDGLSAGTSQPCWTDDNTDLKPVLELVRQSTAGGAVSKKGQNNTNTETVELRAPWVISGEGFDALTTQRAYTNRVVVVETPDPTQRMSLKQDGHLQWDDVIALDTKYPDLSAMAGTLARLFIKEGLAALESIPSAIGSGGRNADHHRILVVGARILSAVTGDPKWPGLVQAWVRQEEQVDRTENALTLLMIPSTIQRLGPYESATHPVHPSVYGLSGLIPPVLVKGTDVRVNLSALAEYWRAAARSTGIEWEERVHSEQAITAQATDVCEPKVKRMRLAQGRGVAPTREYRVLRPEYAQRVLERVAGVTVDRASHISPAIQTVLPMTTGGAPATTIDEFVALWDNPEMPS